MLIKAILLATLLKILIVTGRPAVCALIYGIVTLVVALVFGHGILQVLLNSALLFCVSYVYFWLLHRFTDRFFIWWLIAFLGALGLVFV